VSLGTILGDDGFCVHLIEFLNIMSNFLKQAVVGWPFCGVNGADSFMHKNYKYGVGALTLLPLALSLSVSRVGAQVVPTAIDGTVVNQTGNQFGISGGQVSGDGTNLFHTFDRFGLSQGQVADFLANPQVRNIFGRVVGGEASAIDGLLRVSGGECESVFDESGGNFVWAECAVGYSGGVYGDNGEWDWIWGWVV
jgi:haemagglutination activity domain